MALALTQEELADLAGVGLSSVRALEGGSERMTLAVALRILDALGLRMQIGPREGGTGPGDVELRMPSRGE